MIWTFLTENWAEATARLAESFPHAGELSQPQSLSDLTAFLMDIADRHDLTLFEAAELLDDLALMASSTARYASEVTHKIVASS
jgi:hypothetical protein